MKQLITTLLLSCALGAQAQHVMTVNVSRPTAKIQPTMYGIFFEDINFGADGGLYAELVKNRSFEFPQPFVGWVPFGNVTVQDAEPCFDRNPHYVRIVNDGRRLRAGLDNEGFRGIGLKQGEEYRFTAYARTPDARPMKLSVELLNSRGENLLTKEIEISGNSWQKQTVLLHSPGIHNLYGQAFSFMHIKGKIAGCILSVALPLKNNRCSLLPFPFFHMITDHVVIFQIGRAHV